MIYLLSKEASQKIQETGELDRGFPLKVLVEAVDKLTRLKMHIDSGGVTKTAHVNIDLSQSLMQDIVMEACMEIERVYPNVNSRELIKNIFAKHVSAVKDKIK